MLKILGVGVFVISLDFSWRACVWQAAASGAKQSTRAKRGVKTAPEQSGAKTKTALETRK